MKKTLAIVMVSLITTSMVSILLSQVKVDSSIPPQIEWSRTYGGTYRDQVSSMMQTSDGGYILAGYQHVGAIDIDFMVVRTDDDGNLLWNKTYGGPTNPFGGSAEWAESVVQTDDGGYAIVGSSDSFGLGDWDGWFVKIDLNGNVEWNKTYGGDGGEGFRSCVETADGGFAMAGENGEDIWLVRTNSTGHLLWNKTYGGSETEKVWCVIQSSDWGYVMAGYTYSYGTGVYDIWLVKTDSYGNIEWNQTYGGTGLDSGEAVIQTSDGGYAISGYTTSYGAGEGDFWLIKLSSEAPPPAEEMTFFPPYQEGPCGKLSWDMWNAFAECEYSTDIIGGIGHIEMDNWALIGLGKAYSTVHFSLKKSWTSGSTGTARIAAAFNLDGFMRAIGASSHLLLPGSGLSTATLNASISVRDMTTELEIGRKDKIIFREEVSWRDLILPLPTGKTEYYDNAGYTIHDYVNLQKGHEYAWIFSMKMEGQVASVGWAGAFAQGDITATLNQVWIEPPDPWTPPPEEPPPTEDMMHIGVSCPVTLLVTDPAGRQIGFDPVLQVEVNEIPNAYYDGGSEAQLISISQPIPGDYNVEVYGTDIGDYTLILLASVDGVLLNTFDYGEIVEGAVYVYRVSITDEMMTSSPDPPTKLEHLKEFIDGLPDDAFDKPKLTSQKKNSLFNKIDEVILKVEAGNYTDAINKLLQDIRAKMDGDSTAQDWIVDAETQSSLCVIIDHMISSIETLQQE